MTSEQQILPGPRLAIFTDFDGTLVEIAETPDGIAVPETLADELRQTAESFDHAFAVITGRVIADVDRWLAPAVLPVAGSHGAERRRADGTYEAPPLSAIVDAEQIADSLAPFVEEHPGLILERKDASVALHYRQAPELEAEARHAMAEAARPFADFTVVPGKMVLEARRKNLHKGDALRAFMLEEPFAGRLPIFIGDDVTDEDGFIAAQELGGVGIKIGPGETHARLRAADIEAVRRLLSGLAEAARARQQTEH